MSIALDELRSAETLEEKGANPPFVSVMLNASRHREFVFEAIDSVRRQTLDRSKFELVVIRDYDDERLERVLTENGIRSVRVGAGDIGSAIRAGVQACRGEVLAFLDDDDRFLPNKLSFVHDLFWNQKDLGFLRNNYVVIDGGGHQRPEHPFRANQRRNVERLGQVTLVGSDRVERLRQLPALGVDFNSSCMAIRRELIRAFIGTRDLSGFGLLDELALFAALTSTSSVCIDSSVLTEYRIHPRNLSLEQQPGVDPLSRRATFSRTYLPSYAKLVEAVRGTGDRLAIEEAEGLFEVQLAYAAIRERSSRRSTFIRLRHEITARRFAFLVRSETRLRQALWLFGIAPSIARWLYAREVASLGT